MRFDIITLFPDMFAPLRTSIIDRASKKGVIEIVTHQLRDFAVDKHGTVDDSPYGGGPGMVMRIDAADKAIQSVKSLTESGRTQIILPSADGRVFNQKEAEKLSQYDRLILLCPHYEGVDERVRDLVDAEYTIGDYILTGGELPAMVMIDAITRLIPGALGKEESAAWESFTAVVTDKGKKRLLEYPQYTRPEEWHGKKVPQVLLSGHHGEIEKWRKEQALKRTKQRRPDLLNI